MKTTQWQQMRPTLIGGAISFLAALIIAFLLIPISDLDDLVNFLLISSIPSLVIGYLLFVLGQSRLKYIHLKILLAYGLGVAIAVINIYVTSRLMFLSEHDFILLGLLLVFAGLLSISFGITLAAGITTALQKLKLGSQKLAQGDLSTRVTVPYQDEFSDVATAFNIMAARLEESFTRQKVLEQSRRDLIAAVSHDLRTPLASIQALVEALTDQVVTDEATVRRYHQTIQSQVTNLSALIDDLFALAKLDSGRLSLVLEEASLSDLISDTLESMRAQAAAKEIDLSGQVDSELPVMKMEVAKVQRVFNNLVQNAIRHTPAGGRITITACDTPEGVRVEVADTGEGIPADDLPRIFDEFYRGEKSRSRSTGGTGLGLAIAKGIIEAHGGQIWAETQLGAGTAFRFVLPHTLK